MVVFVVVHPAEMGLTIHRWWIVGSMLYQEIRVRNPHHPVVDNHCRMVPLHSIDHVYKHPLVVLMLVEKRCINWNEDHHLVIQCLLVIETPYHLNLMLVLYRLVHRCKCQAVQSLLHPCRLLLHQRVDLH